MIVRVVHQKMLVPLSRIHSVSVFRFRRSFRVLVNTAFPGPEALGTGIEGGAPLAEAFTRSTSLRPKEGRGGLVGRTGCSLGKNRYN